MATTTNRRPAPRATEPQLGLISDLLDEIAAAGGAHPAWADGVREGIAAMVGAGTLTLNGARNNIVVLRAYKRIEGIA